MIMLMSVAMNWNSLCQLVNKYKKMQSMVSNNMDNTFAIYVMWEINIEMLSQLDVGLSTVEEQSDGKLWSLRFSF